MPLCLNHLTHYNIFDFCQLTYKKISPDKSTGARGCNRRSDRMAQGRGGEEHGGRASLRSLLDESPSVVNPDASFDDKEIAQRPGKGHPGGDYQRQIERVSRIHYPAGHDRREGGKHKPPKFWIAATEATLCSATITCTSPRAGSRYRTQNSAMEIKATAWAMWTIAPPARCPAPTAPDR